MQKIVQYWYTNNNETIIKTTPPEDKYQYNYMIRFKLKADNGHVLYNIHTRNAEKTVIIFPNYEKDWVELSFEEFQELKANNH